MNAYTGEVRSWDSLTPEQQKSGEWIRLPHDAGIAQRDPMHALRKAIPITKLDEDPELSARRADRIVRALNREQSQFTNRGRSR